MADEKKTEAEPKKGKGKLIILVVAAVVLLGGAGAGAMLLLGGGGEEAQAAETSPAEAAPATEKESLVSLDTFVVNLADPKGDRFCKATLRAIVTDERAGNRLLTDDLIKTRSRDRILTVLSSKTFADVSTPLGKEALRREIARELNKTLGEEVVKEILFVEFVVQ